MGLTTDDATVTGTLRVGTAILPGILRSQIIQDNLKPFVIPLTSWRVWDAVGTNLPAVAAADDLGLVGGTWTTNSLSIQTKDETQNAALTSSFALATVSLPYSYVSAETVTIRAHAGILTTLPDQSGTLDFVAYESDKATGISADLVTTAAQDIANLTAADYDFQVTATNLVAGDTLDIRMDIALHDVASGAGVIGVVGWVALLCDVKG